MYKVTDNYHESLSYMTIKKIVSQNYYSKRKVFY